jgi:hypothetical protein
LFQSSGCAEEYKLSRGARDNQQAATFPQSVTRCSQMPLVDLNSKPSSRTERENSIPRTKQALKDNYGADVTACDDEEDAQAAEYEDDDNKIKDTDTSHPPFVPRTRVAMDPDDEEEEKMGVAPLEQTKWIPDKTMNPGKTTKIVLAAAATSASSSATPTSSTAAEETLPLFLPSSSPSPEPSSPTARHRRPKEEPGEPEEPLFFSASQETSAGDPEEQEKSQTYRSLFGSSSQTSSTGYDEQEEKFKEEKEQPKEDAGEAAPPERSPPLAQRSGPAILQALDANRTIDNSAQYSAAAKGNDALSDANDGCTTPLARTPTQGTFDAAHWQGRGHGDGGDRTPIARSPKSQGQGNGNMEGKAQATSPRAKPRSNKRPAEDPASPRRSSVKASKAENAAPIADERNHKMMRKA